MEVLGSQYVKGYFGGIVEGVGGVNGVLEEFLGCSGFGEGLWGGGESEEAFEGFAGSLINQIPAFCTALTPNIDDGVGGVIGFGVAVFGEGEALRGEPAFFGGAGRDGGDFDAEAVGDFLVSDARFDEVAYDRPVVVGDLFERVAA